MKMRMKMKNKSILAIAFVMLFCACGSDKGYKAGDFYDEGGVEAVVVTADSTGVATMLMSVAEAKDIDADSAKLWASSLGEGWTLPTSEEMNLLYRNRSYINETLEGKKLPTLFGLNTYYWTSTPCSESHVNARGPDGIKCYLASGHSACYRARAVKKL